MMSKVLAAITFLFLFSACGNSQNNSNLVGGPCEGCEAIYEYGNIKLKATDTFPGFSQSKNKIKINGTVLKKDGKTPAENIILYVYHTDALGRYPTKPSSKGWEKRHGYLRGWLKTDNKGYFEFYTTRPASYPNSTVPQHIHITVKEPDKNEYYVEDFYFADDPHITPNILNRVKPRGGSGVIHLKGNSNLKTAKRDIILGLNIPNYPN